MFDYAHVLAIIARVPPSSASLYRPLHSPVFFFPRRGCAPFSEGCTPVGPVGPHRLRYERQLFFFRSRSVVSLRLTPGSLTTPFGGGTNPLRGLVTRRLMRAHACAYTCVRTRVSCNFGLFEPISSHFVRLGLAKIVIFFFDRLPSGAFF